MDEPRQPLRPSDRAFVSPAQARADAEAFGRLAQYKRPQHASPPLIGADLVDFYKEHVERRQNRFGKLADIWATFIPSTLLPHTCLESFHAGTLKVLVDSSSHLFELKTVFLAGLEKQILLAGRSAGLRKITTRLGRWYEGDDSGKLKFD
jgi:hypothetical protein